MPIGGINAIKLVPIAVLILVFYQAFALYNHNTVGFIHGSKVYNDKQYNMVDNDNIINQNILDIVSILCKNVCLKDIFVNLIAGF